MDIICKRLTDCATAVQEVEEKIVISMIIKICGNV